MVTAIILPDKMDDALKIWKESVAPATLELTGFINARLFVNHATNKVCTSGLWESEADFEASTQWSQVQINKFAALFAAPPTVETYELVTDVNGTLRAQLPPSQDIAE